MDLWNTIIIIAALVGIANGVVSILDKLYIYGKPALASLKKISTSHMRTLKKINQSGHDPLEAYLLSKPTFTATLF
jgi:hypothetical protein